MGAGREVDAFKYYEEPDVTGPLGTTLIYDNCNELDHYLADYNEVDDTYYSESKFNKKI